MQKSATRISTSMLARLSCKSDAAMQRARARVQAEQSYTAVDTSARDALAAAARARKDAVATKAREDAAADGAMPWEAPDSSSPSTASPEPELATGSSPSSPSHRNNASAWDMQRERGSNGTTVVN